MSDRLQGRNTITDNVPGAQGATLGQINEIIRGSTIRALRTEKAMSPQGGEAVMLELNNGDKLIFVATPGERLAINEPSAFIQPVLLTRRGSKLKV